MALLKPMILEYFSSLFTLEVDEVDLVVMEKVHKKVSTQMNERLLAPFTPEEVKKAAFSIGDYKALGPDGLHAVFTRIYAKMKKQPGNKNLRWSKPVPRQIKVNVDGSFLHDDHTGVVGAILRDHDGHFIAASTMYIPNLASVAVGEAMALREGLSLAHHIGCNNVIAESDSLEIVEACTGAEVWWGDSAPVSADCVDLMALIGTVQVQHCPSEANGAAHMLAKFCSSDKSSCNWVDEPPSFLLDMLVNDVTIL
nr:uncharacterized protein LOC127328299 [Lolium perenne]